MLSRCSTDSRVEQHIIGLEITVDDADALRVEVAHTLCNAHEHEPRDREALVDVVRHAASRREL